MNKLLRVKILVMLLGVLVGSSSLALAGGCGDAGTMKPTKLTSSTLLSVAAGGSGDAGTM
ncbi:hypothetical protein [Deinococcus peraridilitoris]|uniref:hypothetical protein n=1 Tax=Deinococcus peraridilitoris TaxID=432329 RepID=UPI0012F94A3E|nr:hypothetical protein [Deinococcus peraridilitoris]